MHCSDASGRPSDNGGVKSKVLIIGFGNTLRRDDGVGRLVARQLASKVQATVVEAHQLLPEHIEMLAEAECVVLVDAVIDQAPGTIHRTKLSPTDCAAPAVDHHRLGPQGLVNAARRLYSASPEVWLVTIGAARVELGEGLSPEVEASVADAVATVVELVRAS